MEKRTKKTNAQTPFPIRAGIVRGMPEIFPKNEFRILCWHEELQLNLVTQGAMEIWINGICYFLNAGEAILINRNFLHKVMNLTEDAQYVKLHFPDRLLGFCEESEMAKKAVYAFTRQYAFSAVVFRKEIPWQAEILEELGKLQTLLLYTIPQKVEKYAAYRAALLLSGIWYRLICHTDGEFALPSRGMVRKLERIQSMLSYLHENYGKTVRLSDIAAAGDASEGECCRCFQEMTGDSSGRYLMGYRISKAAELLTKTGDSLAEIAEKTGLSDTSHFIQYFRRQYGVTPKEYREQLRL